MLCGVLCPLSRCDAACVLQSGIFDRRLSRVPLARLLVASATLALGALMDHVTRQRSNHAMERTATRRAFTFRVTSGLSLQAVRALAGRRSSCFR